MALDCALCNVAPTVGDAGGYLVRFRQPILHLGELVPSRQTDEAAYFDYEQISIETPSWAATSPLELAPTKVHELLDALDVVLRKQFGVRGARKQ
jgi:hypothetical protein